MSGPDAGPASRRARSSFLRNTADFCACFYSWLAGGACAFALLVSTIILALAGQLETQQQKSVTIGQASARRAELEGLLNSVLSLTKGAEARFAVEGVLDQKTFSDYARELLGNNVLVRNIGFIQNGIILYVYPTEGNERAIGTDLKTIPDQWPAVQRAIDLGRVVVTDPFNLIQGGVGIAQRAPVYRAMDRNRGELVGLVSMIVDVTTLVNDLSLPDEIPYAVRGKDGRVFVGDPAIFSAKVDPIIMDVLLPDGTWHIGVPTPTIFTLKVTDQFRISGGIVLLLWMVMLLSGMSVEFYIRKNRSAFAEITRRRLDQKSTEDRFSIIFENVVDGIITTDVNGNILSANPAASRLLGYGRAEMTGMNAASLVTIPYRLRIQPALRRRRTDSLGLARIGPEIDGLRKDGTAVPLEISISESQVGQTHLFTVVLRDISERKRIETMKNEFISTVNHELRTPLTSIKGSLSLLNAGVIGDLPDNIRQMVSIAYTNADRLVRLVNDVLDMERIEAGKMTFRMERIDVTGLIERATGEIKGFADQQGVRFVETDGVPGSLVIGDRDRLIQVLTNLLSNAIKFSPRGAEIAISVIRRPGTLRIAITDKGTGIPAEFR